MFEIVFPRHGAILNRNHGKETSTGLEITVTGIGGATGDIRVNGKTADYDGSGFSAPVVLQEQYNTITVEMEDSRGAYKREIKVVWDKASFKRYDFFIDDHSFFLTDLAKNTPKSLFDHFYLKFLQDMHKKYGTKFSLNLFYRNDHDPDKFTLDKMPDLWKGEWKENANWLRLAFHAYSEFPDRPYQNALPGTLGRDYDLIANEIIRFAGEEALIPSVALHWAIARPESYHELTDRGVKAMEGQFINPRTGISDAGSRDLVCDVGYFLNLDDSRYLEAQGVLYDFRHKLIFYKGDCTANLWTEEQIKEKIAKAASSKRDFISLATHEQYSFKDYFNYLPDHFARMERCISETVQYGYEPVFFAEGMMGNPVWDKE